MGVADLRFGPPPGRGDPAGRRQVGDLRADERIHGVVHVGDGTEAVFHADFVNVNQTADFVRQASGSASIVAGC